MSNITKEKQEISAKDYRLIANERSVPAGKLWAEEMVHRRYGVQ